MDFDRTIAQLKAIFTNNKWTVATAESLTAGLVSSYLASISGSSNYLLGGVAAYTIPIKAKMLGVDKEMALACNAYSPEVARQMVEGICDRERFGSDIGIATTGYAEPSPDDSIEVPQAYVALSILGDVKIKQIMAPNMLRNEAKDYIAKQAIIFLLEELENTLANIDVV